MSDRSAPMPPFEADESFKHIADVPLSRGEILQLTYELRNGRRSVHLRVWFPRDGTMRRSNFGFHIPVRSSGPLAAAFQAFADAKETYR